MVVVGERTPIWPIIVGLIIVVLVVVAILLFILTGGRTTLLVVPIPGFPVESIILGLGLGVLLVLLKRKPASNNKNRAQPS